MCERNMQTECWTCKHRRSRPGDCHISCAKPDPDMKGRKQGIKGGWFWYPVNFDPVWKLKDCKNYESYDKLTS